ncbi:MAG: type IV pilus secretin PilQ [Deltaproteobacteria bacterium]|nr:type IV pilus secretin PilQ [Deltaproteobacteria bacterium]
MNIKGNHDGWLAGRHRQSAGRSRGILASFVLVVFLLAAGCAAEQAAVKGSETPAPAAGVNQPASPVVLASVVGAGNAVIIESDVPLKYTAFGLSDPPRVIVDMPGASVENVKSPIAVNNDFITEILASTYGIGGDAIGRIEIGLKAGVGHDIKSGDKSILIELSKEGAGAAADAVTPADEKEAALTEGKREETSPTATTITDVTATREGSNTVVRIEGDGRVGNYNTFALDDPARVVIDVWNVKSAMKKRNVQVGLPMVDRVRVGSYADKVRFVLDSSGKAVPPYHVEKAGSALVVIFGAEKKEALPLVVVAGAPEAKTAEKAKEAAPEAAITPSTTANQPSTTAGTPSETVSPAVARRSDEKTANAALVVASTPSTTVKKVDFKKFKDTARLTIVNSAHADYQVKESLDGKTVTVDIQSAVIPEELKMTLDAADLGTPVSTISAYQSSPAPDWRVRVLVRLSERASYEVTEDNGAINVDFPARAAMAVKAPQKSAEKPAEASAVEAEKESGAPTAVVIAAGGKEPLPEKKYTGRRISIDMVDAKVTDILKLLAEVSNLNIIASGDVVGTITLRLTDVPWDQAFDLILKVRGLDKIQEGNIVRVAPLDNIRQEKEAVLAARKAAEKLEELQTEYIRINYDKAASLSAQVKSVLSDRGSITVHEPTNTLVIKDVKSAIEGARFYIRKVDIPIPQVLIEARIVEAESSFARDLGIQWGIDQRGAGNRVHTSVFGSAESFGQQAPQPATQTGPATGQGVAATDKTGFTSDLGVTNYAVNLPASGTAGTLGALGFILGRVGANPMLLDLRISAGEQDGLVKTISRPRIVTMNNKEAKISQGESIPFSTTSATGTQTIFIDANLSLTVKPQITPDGSVLMEIKANRNSIGSFRTSGGEPSINKKEATTNVLVGDGETTVMGGIIVSDTNRSERGIPFFKDIPVLGWIFKGKSISDSQKELLIFITPTIIKDKTRG